MVTLPQSMEQIWYWFHSLHSSRQDSFGGECALTYTEMLSYFVLVDVEPEEWEVALLKRLDILYLNHSRSKQRKDQAAKPKTKPK